MDIFFICLIIIIFVVISLIMIDFILKKLADRQKQRNGVANIYYYYHHTVIRYRRFHSKFTSLIVYMILTGCCLAALFPFFWMITSSLKTPMESVAVDKLVIFAAVPQWNNYIKIFKVINIWTGLFNTILVEIVAIPPSIFFSALEAYAFAKMKMKHKNTYLLILLSGLMIPYASVLLPQFKAYFALGLNNTLWPLILPSFFGNVSIMFFFIQFMRGVPNALFEAAKIDGSGHFKSFLHIMLPIMAPALGVQAVFMFVANWNDFFAPSIYLSNENVKTLQVMLQSLAYSGTARPLLFTGAFITCIPLFIIYFIFQKYFVGALAISGIKG